MKDKDENIEHEYTQNIICPWCGAEDIDSWEIDGDYEEDVECEECGKTYIYERIVDVSYTTTKTKCKVCHYKLRGREYLVNPYIHADKNWTLYTCVDCDNELSITSEVILNIPYIADITDGVLVDE